jgi:hypothetical protein
MPAPRPCRETVRAEGTAIGDAGRTTLRLRFGLCAMAVRASDVELDRHLQEVALAVPSWVQTRPQRANCALMLVSPSRGAMAGPHWQPTGRAWAQARQALRDAYPSGLAAWRALYRLGDLIDQGSFLFQDGGWGRSGFFCLVPADTLRRPRDHAAWIIHAVEALATYWHVLNGGGPLHASAIARRGKGYLFLGTSGAGKSTVAHLSAWADGAAIHDDHVMLGVETDGYRLAHAGSPSSPFLHAVFLLRKGTSNHVTPLGPLAVCAALTRGVLEYAVGQNRFGPWVRQAFQNMAKVARRVPGYTLEFRKSPDFWDVIDAELGE